MRKTWQMVITYVMSMGHVVSFMEVMALSTVIGFSIFLSLPLVMQKNQGRKRTSFLNAVAVGILIFLIADVFLDAASMLYDGSLYGYGSSPASDAVFAISMAGGFLLLFTAGSRGKTALTQTQLAMVIALGIAFQIMDDVLNLAGFAGDLKTRGEDLHQGKVTMPVATAMGRLDAPGRRRLWDILSARTEDPALVAEGIALIEECGALDACRADAQALVEAGWARLEPVLPDSHAKLQLRTFGWYVLDRHH